MLIRYQAPISTIRQLRLISQDELVVFIVQQSRALGDNPFNWQYALAENGFLPAFQNINFRVLAEQLANLDANQSLPLFQADFSYLTFRFCDHIQLVNKSVSYCSFEQCANMQMSNTTIAHSTVNDCEIRSFADITANNLVISGCHFNEAKLERIMTTNSISADNRFTNCTTNLIAPVLPSIPKPPSTLWKTELHNILSDISTPIIVSLYMAEHGTSNTDALLAYLIRKKMNIITVHPDLGMQHPVFIYPHRIDGLILPGGDDIQTDSNKYGVREHFELDLINFSLDNSKPLIGVCRGHQMVGHFFGGDVRDLDITKRKTMTLNTNVMSLLSHNASHINVSNFPGSLLHHKCAKKYKSNKKAGLTLSSKSTFQYSAICAHSQEVILPMSPPHGVHIAAMSEDGCAESLQVKDHIITFQHHHEQGVNADDNIGRGALGIFKTMVKDHHQKTLRSAKRAKRLTTRF